MKLENWQEQTNPICLKREWKFKNFKQAWDLVNRISEYSEKINHHPDISFGWGYLSVSLVTHSKNAITDADYEFAVAIDKIASNEEI